MQLRVSDLMRPCKSSLVLESTSLRDAAEMLLSAESPFLIALGPSGRLSGVIAEAAIIRQLMADPNRNTTVECVISRHVESVRINTVLTEVLHLFRSSCNSAVPVVDEGGILAGILHRQDVVRFLLEDDQPNQKPDSTRAPHFLRKPDRPRIRGNHEQNGDAAAGH